MKKFKLLELEDINMVELGVEKNSNCTVFKISNLNADILLTLEASGFIKKSEIKLINGTIVHGAWIRI